MSSRDLEDFKNEISTLESFVTDPQWLTMLKFDMAFNHELSEDLVNYINYIKQNSLGSDGYEKLMIELREKCVQIMKEANLLKNKVLKWKTYRRAYAYYGFIETITEGSIITDEILNSFYKKYGDNYLKVLKEIDRLKPSTLTNFNDDDVLPDKYKTEDVKLYLLMKRWQDDQHVFHEEILHPNHQKARIGFENIARKEIPELNDVYGKSLIALYVLSNERIININTLSRYVIGGMDSELALVVGGKNLGLAKLNANGLPIPDTYLITVNSLKKNLYIDDLDTLEDYSYSVRSSATTEDNDKQSFAGMFTSVLDVKKLDLGKAIKVVKDSVNSSRVLAYTKHFNTKKPEMAIVLQKFEEPEYSGVWIGNDLNSGHLEWTFGNGEKLVSGKVRPASENWPSCNDNIIKVNRKPVGQSCLEVQGILNSPADLEWCILDGELIWLQYRPVTKIIEEVKQDNDNDAYIGVAASSGVVKGNPIYLEDIEDSIKFEDGSILLTDYTDPDWVPVMLKASAIITAEGGFLSHSAIISRELGIPCVTGLGYKAIEELSQSDIIEVNGNAGKVKTLQAPKH